MRYVLKFVAVLFILSSCNSYKAKYPYSIGDFRPEIREILEKIVQRGSTSSYYSTQLEEICSVEDLQKLFKCEHPAVRACTFSALIAKDSNNVENILFSSLDDTAIISYNRGEFGMFRMYCADYYLYTLKYKSKITEEKVLDNLLLHHTNLENTYNELSEIDSLPEKYYTIVKAMALKTVDSESWYGNPNISYEYQKQEDILMALSKYKKKDDIEFIRNHLNTSKGSTWKIIQTNPDTAYFKVIEAFFNRIVKSYEISYANLQLLYYGYNDLGKDFPEYLKAVAKYKNDKSIKIFLTILNKRLYPIRGLRNTVESFKADLFNILNKENCAAYSTLIKQLKSVAEIRNKHIFIMDSYNDATVTSNSPVQQINYW